MNRKEKKILLQQKIIDTLSSQNNEMKEKIQLLETELELEKNIPQEGYKEAKKLIQELQNCKNVYEQKLHELHECIDKYETAKKELYKMKIKYKNEMDKLYKSIKLGIK